MPKPPSTLQAVRLNHAGLLKADIVKERLALEGAIREIEAEAARKSRTEMPTALRPKTPPASTRRRSMSSSSVDCLKRGAAPTPCSQQCAPLTRTLLGLFKLFED